MSQQQLINSFINLNQLFTILYQLKFKGRKVIEELINTFYELQLLHKSSLRQRQTIIFQTAIVNCQALIINILSNFEADMLQRYVDNMIFKVTCVQKVKLNRDYLQSTSGKKTATNLSNPYQLLLLQLVQLGLDLSREYQAQLSLIRSQWGRISSEILLTGREPQGLKEFMLHVGFETYVEEATQDTWRIKLAALSNQRYNPKKG